MLQTSPEYELPLSLLQAVTGRVHCLVPTEVLGHHTM